jgi:hypothetical protein
MQKPPDRELGEFKEFLQSIDRSSEGLSDIKKWPPEISDGHWN